MGFLSIEIRFKCEIILKIVKIKLMNIKNKNLSFDFMEKDKYKK
jgi:hypothetical protein